MTEAGLVDILEQKLALENANLRPNTLLLPPSTYPINIDRCMARLGYCTLFGLAVEHDPNVTLPKVAATVVHGGTTSYFMTEDK